jgi:hypothetical protein
MYATPLTDRTDRTATQTPSTCPDCGAATVPVQGLSTCGTCRWHGPSTDE